MKPAGDPHLRFRQLIADRLDGALEPDDAPRLRAHLALCPRCRIAERAYLRDRHQLRLIRPLPPPRDLWARTSAALDREIARRPKVVRGSRVHRRARRAHPPALMLSALASLVLGVAVVATQLRPSSQIGAPDGPTAALPTPFDVPTQALAFVELTDEGLAIYQTTVDRACPPVAIDCAEVSTARRRVIAAPGELTAVDLDLHEADGRLALLTSDDLGNDTVSVVTLPGVVADPVPPFVGPLPSDGPIAPTPPLSPPPPSLPGPATAPAVSPSGSSGTVPGATSPGASAISSQPTASPGDSAPPGDAASVSAPASDGPTDPGRGGPGGSTMIPGAPAEGSTAASLPVPSTSPVPAEVLAVLEDVRVVGARPAWSPDGGMLAFSAMPGDASGGPDVYIWRTGDDGAERLTDDGMSYFASWSGRRVVVSRPESTTDGEETYDSGIRASTFVIDPATRLERRAAGGGGWLPAIDPSGRSAITWHGELAAVGRAVVPVRGALSLVDWRAIDPFRATSSEAGASAEPDASAEVNATAEPDASAEVNATAEPDATTPRVKPRRGERGQDGRRVGRRGASATPLASPPATAPATSPSPLPVKEPRPNQMLVEPERDVQADPVREWQIHWSADSSAFGFWVTETPGAEWGQLAVLRVGSSSSSIDRESSLLAPTLARRSFTLGRDRVAWVAPSEDRPDGELRLRTWGSRGFGSLRIREFDVSSGLPAF